MTTITTINSGDLISNSRTDINNNFTNLNNGKIETSVIDTDTSLTANSDSKIPSQKAIKAYVDSNTLAIASETAKGVVEEATDAEVVAGTATGSTGAKLFITPAKFANVRTKLDTYTSSGTWTKPTGAKMVFVQVWGAGGSGARGSTATGGGGGGYGEFLFDASTLGSTETVTVGTGGAAKTTNSNGSAGGNSSFGSKISAGGGSGGVQSSTYGAGGTGGSGFSTSGYSPAIPWVLVAGSTYVNNVDGITAGGINNNFNPGTPIGRVGSSIYGGGAGQGYYNSNPSPLMDGTTYSGGNSIYGGGGGAAAGYSGGTSILGGSGGAGSASGNGTDGVAPAGGGGASNVGTTSGAGARGEVRVTTFF